MAVAVVLGGEGYQQNLRETESPSVLNGASSWSESWRGLGSWLLYHRDQTGLARPQVQIYLTSAITILGTFAAPVLALVTMAVSRHRVRILGGAMMALGLTVMVGLYPLDDPSPYGRLLGAAYDRVEALRFLRNNYKAGSGAMWATSALAGLAVADIAARLAVWRRRRIERTAAGADRVSAAAVGAAALAGVVLLAAMVQPFWRTGIYDPARSVAEVPGYVTDAMAFLDEQEPDGRAFFLPRAYRSGFRWGHVNDDVLDTYLGRPNLIEVPIHVSRAVPADILSAIDRSLVDRHHQPGSIGAYARRLGISYVVLRNDFDWATWSQPRPSEFTSLRRDPSLELVATFGERGQFTTSRRDDSFESGPERRLHPIEIYRVVEPGPLVRLAPPAGDLLVAGDGEAWPQLAETGLLDGDAPVRFTGAMTTDELTAALDDGAGLLLTDTNRRRVEVITVTGEQSATLPAGGELDRPPHVLWPTPGAETVATYGDAVALTAQGAVTFTSGLQPWHRPAMATDGDPTTTWLVGGLIDPRGERFRIELAREHPIGTVDITAAPPGVLGDRVLSEVIVRLDDGTERQVELEDRTGTVDFGGVPARSIEIVVADVDGRGAGAVGLAEVAVDGVDLVERIAAADDVARRAAEHPELAAALRQAPIAYGFQRAIGQGLEDEERTVRRSFVVPAPAVLTGSGRLKVDGDAPEALLADIAGSVVRAEASVRLNDSAAFAGIRAVDGRSSTGWVVEPEPGATLTLEFEPQVVDRVTVRLRVGQGLGRPTELVVRDNAGLERRAPVGRQDCPVSDQCTQRVDIELPPGERDHLELEIAAIRQSDLGTFRAIRVDEVEVGDLANGPGAAAALDETCIDDLVLIDGVSVAVRLDGDRRDALAGDDLVYTTCDPVTLAAGPHHLDTGAGILMDTLLLAPDRPLVAQASDPIAEAGTGRTGGVDAARLVATGQTRFEVDVDAPAGGRLILTQSWHPAWQASIDGGDLGPPIELDGFVAWDLPAGSGQRVVVEFGWQRYFEIAVALSGIGVALCLWLLLRREPGT
jgi:arabinofuranan 3-O-arabinosyltransferase